MTIYGYSGSYNMQDVYYIIKEDDLVYNNVI